MLGVVVGLLVSLCQNPPQDSRADLLQQQREEKAQQAEANEPEPLLQVMDFIEGRAVFLLTREGFHPKLGSLTTGSGFAAGIGFRNRSLLRHQGTIELWTAGSAKRYWAMEARATLPALASGRIAIDAVATRREYPREDFFGVGPDSRRRDHSVFSLRTQRAGGRAGVRVTRPFTIGGGVEHWSTRVGGGSGHGPSIERVFTPDNVPGFDAGRDFVKTMAVVEFDYREPLNAREGGWYRVEVGRYADRTDGAYSFSRTDVDVRQYVGFLQGRRVIALRGWVATTPDDQRVPFYLMPTLGGNDTLRGFRNYRFRARNALLLQGEYRWEIWSGLEGALFYDAGRVADRRGDLTRKGLERNYGFGFRFNTDKGVVLRIDAAFGSRDGKHLHIVFGGVF